MSHPTPASDLEQIIEAAQRLGIHLDPAEALRWLTAMAEEQSHHGDVVVDEREGVFGHRVSMLDFSAEDLSRIRRLGSAVGFKDVPGKVETALALSGSAAQSKIQTYPGDADFFERVNILDDTREGACRTLGELMWEKATETLKGPNYHLLQVLMGSYPQDVVVDGEPRRAGTPIVWLPNHVEARRIDAVLPDGGPATIGWDAMALDPGWCKLDWVFADELRGKLYNCSLMLDVTWEAPDGSITPLDGHLDPYFQEVYLEAESVPIFSKLAQRVSADALDDYVERLEGEVRRYLTRDLNYGKAAKRMYNIFRLTGRFPEAAFLRALFDGPGASLYQVWTLILTMDECSRPGTSISVESLRAHADNLVMAAVEALEGEQESRVVRSLLHLRNELEGQVAGQPLTGRVEAVRAEVIDIVNDFFLEKLAGYPTIKAYMDGFQQQV